MTKKMTKVKFEEIPENELLNSVLFGTSYFASLHKPNTAAQKKFGADPCFKISLGLDEENLKKAEEMGLTIKEPNETIPEPHVVIKRKIKQGKTEEQCKPELVDSLNTPIPESILIGNGSKVYVKFGRYWYDNGGGGVGSTLFKVQVRELVQYDGGVDPTLGIDEDGFSVKDVLQEKPSSRGSSSVDSLLDEDDDAIDVE